ncbi:hypothetical protein Anas_11428, partial [Armadillidium nasatum]
QRNPLQDIYTPQAGTVSLLNIGGFNTIHNQSSQPNLLTSPHSQPPLHQQQPQLQATLQPSQPNLPPANNLTFSHHELGLPTNNNPHQTVTIPNVSPYGQILNGTVQRNDANQSNPQCNQNPNKKRKVSEMGNPQSQHGVNIKQEPGPGGGSGGGAPMNVPTIHGGINFNGEEEEFSMDTPSNGFLDPSLQCIRFQPFQQNTWSIICDSSLKN